MAAGEWRAHPVGENLGPAHSASTPASVYDIPGSAAAVGTRL